MSSIALEGQQLLKNLTLASSAHTNEGYFCFYRWRIKLLFWAALIVLPEAIPFCVFARCEDTNLVIDQKDYKNGMCFFATIKNAIEVTVDFDCQSFSNAIPSSRLPVSLPLAGPRRTGIFRFKQRMPNKEWFVGPCIHHWRYGVPNRIATEKDFVYDLPFERGRRFAVSQSYQGRHSHRPGTESEFAIDFLMPLGTPICAARDGVVIAIRNDSTEGGADIQFEHCANFVILRHKDGTYANYVHLNPYSVAVKLGQKVSAGTRLARSGQTGWATEPHLHFDVYRVVSGRHRTTLPVQFRTSSGILNRLSAGESYGSDDKACPEL